MEALFEWNGLSAEVRNAIIAMIFISVLVMIFHLRVSKMDPLGKPSKMIIVMEGLYKFLDDLVRQLFGNRNRLIVPYALTLFIFILVMNYMSLLGFSAPTTNFNVPLGLALMTLVLSQVVSIKDNGAKGYFKGYFEPLALMAPLNFMDLFSRPASLSIRLFGNITSGMMILAVVNMGLLYFQQQLFPVLGDFNVLAVFVNVPLRAYFDLFAGALQALVFTMLSVMYMSV